MTTCAALVIAAGRGARFGTSTPKQYAELAGHSVIRHALSTLSAHPQISCVQSVIHPDDQELFNQASEGLSLAPPVFGGETRQQSVRSGLEALADLNPNYVLVHDGARPNVQSDTIDRVIAALAKGATGAIPAVPIRDSLKSIDAKFQITRAIPRENLVRAQTPQGFKFRSLLSAHQNCDDPLLTDDAAVMQQAGFETTTVQGDEGNVKITDKADLHRLAEAISETRTGIGFDVHRLGPGDGVTLGGIFIPMNKALVGHSDADVLLHAATDAILGALGDGDIGVHFPPSDPKYKDSDSRIFLTFAMERLRAQKGSLNHLDATLICEHPKISQVRDQIRASVAAINVVPVSRISIKATTTEGLGFTGRGEGIACQAIATIRVPTVAY
ncbi:MAG: 2-C-methyl-D-erythritol 4-phosphate cytidylyltransferase [Rhodospirillaceae bacterium]|nr:2-C-methyl-D-erythritol 4-phosphate cytidylyltransferase [Rhodospirillaceae bacterium]